MDTIVRLIIEIIAGALGGNATGAAAKTLSLGTLGNSVVGAIGGVVLGQILNYLGIDPGIAAASAGFAGLDLGAIVAQLVGGGVGGAILTLVAGLIRNATPKRA
jgi:hypothetical protein